MKNTDVLCLAQKDRYHVGDLVALKLSPRNGEERHVNGVVVRTEPNHYKPKEEYAIVRLIGSEAINGLERTFSPKDVFYLNNKKCSIVE